MSDDGRPIDDQVAKEVLDELLNPDLKLRERWARHPHGAGLADFIERMATLSATRNPGVDLLTIMGELSKMAGAILQSCAKDREAVRNGEEAINRMGDGLYLGMFVGLVMAGRYVGMTQDMIDEFQAAAVAVPKGNIN